MHAGVHRISVAQHGERSQSDGGAGLPRLSAELPDLRAGPLARLSGVICGEMRKRRTTVDLV